jgi:hypothetical protein
VLQRLVEQHRRYRESVRTSPHAFTYEMPSVAAKSHSAAEFGAAALANDAADRSIWK